ncbi:MAG TPA: hypothetical protein VNJ07_05140 [Chitinophagales bacterium]|nr:hypothetical protein [Chitinophagales bacterium]
MRQQNHPLQHQLCHQLHCWKRFSVRKINKSWSLGINTSVSWAGDERTEQSLAEEQISDYFRLDTRVSISRERQRVCRNPARAEFQGGAIRISPYSVRQLGRKTSGRFRRNDCKSFPKKPLKSQFIPNDSFMVTVAVLRLASVLNEPPQE